MSVMPAASVLAALLLAACHTRTPAPVQPYYTGALPAGSERLRIDPVVPHPAVTRYGSLDSRLPYYGLLSTRINPDTPAFGHLAVDELLDVAATTRRHLDTQIMKRPALAARFDTQGSLKLMLRIDAIGIFARDVQHTACQPMLVMRAQVVDADGKLRWSSGYSGNRLDEHINYPCATLASDHALAAHALDEALQTGIADIVRRL